LNEDAQIILGLRTHDVSSPREILQALHYHQYTLQYINQCHTGRKLCSTTTLRIAGLEFPEGFTLAFKYGQHDSGDDEQDYCSSLWFEELARSQFNPAYEERGEDGDLVNTVRFAAFTKRALQVDMPELSSRLDNEDGISQS
jgi:hypothetical protein